MIVLIAFTVMGLGLNFVVGYAGLLDLGYVAFFAVGAYVGRLARLPAVRAVRSLVHPRRHRLRAARSASTSRSGS